MYERIMQSMGKISNRDKILTEGMKVVHERGYVGASVRDIVQAAGVPQGSFTNHFTSKEAFGLEILNLYFSGAQSIRDALRDSSVAPLKRINNYIDANICDLNKGEMRNGCLLGNFTAEATEHSEIIRNRLVEIFAEVQEALTQCLKDAVKAEELPPRTNCGSVANFIISGLQGAILLSKAQRTPDAIKNFKKILFTTVLA